MSDNDNTTLMAPVQLAVLPDPSPEQQAIIQAIHEGHCVTVQACAGSGKTTCMLQVAASLPPHRRVLIITYNRSLADDCKARIQKLSMGHHVSCYTIHGLVSKVARQVCNNDHRLVQMLETWDRGGLEGSSDRLALDLVMLDEAQDLRPLFHRCLSHIFGQSKQGLQLCLVGDPKQLLYDFPTFGSDKASSSFFLEPQKHWSQFTRQRTWVKLPLSVSYRLTPNVASFCNLFWGTSMVGGNKSNSNRPVEYLLKYAYPNTTGNYDPNKLSTSFLANIIDKHGPENVLFLAQSIKSVDLPIRVHVNELMKIEDPLTGQQKYNFHIKETARGFEGTSDWTNKVRVWTFCGSKGCEADVVIVFGFDVFRRAHGLNQIGVALSRARKRLLVIHGKQWCREDFKFEALPYYPVLGDASEGMEHYVKYGIDNTEELKLIVPPLIATDYTDRSRLTKEALLHLAKNSVIKLDIGGDSSLDEADQIQMPETRAIAVQKQIEEVYVASNFSYFSALAELKFLDYGKWETIEAMDSETYHEKRIHYETDVQFANTKEDVSALYGEAVTYMIQWELHKFVPNIETVVSNGILRLYPQVLYSEGKIKELLRGLFCEELTKEDSDLLEKEFVTNGGVHNKLKGLHLIPFLNTRLSLKKKRSFQEKDASEAETAFFPVKATACKSEDDDIQLNEFLPQIQAIYDIPQKKAFHWIYLANAVMAFSNYHEKFRQIGTDPNSYEAWVNETALERGLERLRTTMKKIRSSSSSSSSPTVDGSSAAHSFERELTVAFEEKDRITEANNGRTIVGVTGVCDWVNEESRDNKSPKHSRIGFDIDLLEIKFVHQFSNVHRLQVLIYCALYILEVNLKGRKTEEENRMCKKEEIDAEEAQTPYIESCRGMLYNARTGETEICSIGANEAIGFLLDISQFKYNGRDREELLSEREKLEPSMKEEPEESAVMAIPSSYRRKLPKKRLGQKGGNTYHTAVEILCDDDGNKEDGNISSNNNCAEASSDRSPSSYRLRKRPRKSLPKPPLPAGTDDDPIILM